MALKLKTNAEAFSKVVGMEIKQADLIGWTKAGLIKAMGGEDKKGVDFPTFVRDHFLKNGRALGISKETPEWKKKRGWHHYETFMFYAPKWNRNGRPEVRAGMYATGIKRAGGNTRWVGSLNYLGEGTKPHGKIKESGYLKNAWRSFGGTKRAGEDIQWVFIKGIEKRLRKSAKEEAIK